jgi:hypothetical protein
MDINKYIIELDLMRCWFNVHATSKYYEYTMRQLITNYSYDEIMSGKKITPLIENNLIRLIEDNKIFIHEHLLSIGILLLDLSSP